RERLDRLDTAGIGTRHDPQDAERDELVHELIGLEPAAFVERPEGILTVPVKTVTRRRVPEKDAHIASLNPRHALGHRERAAARCSTSRSTRRPAATACSPGAFVASSRNRAAATTESWCSPRTSWSTFARRTIALSPASSAA